MSFSKSRGQRTLKRRVTLSGVGVHSGKTVTVSICPAAPDSGISFLRTDLGAYPEIPATAASVGATELCTVLGDPRGVFVATTEHLMAALVGLGIDNALVEIDGAEVPVMDGSARPFVAAIDEAGIAIQRPPKRFIRILKPVRVDIGAAYAEFRPYRGTRFEVAIAYDCAIVGKQSVAVELTPETFRRDIAAARTFGFMKDVERLWTAGFARGSSLENSIVVGESAVINPGGLRYPDEFARHKLLDAIGDLALAGAPFEGLYRSYKGGHRLNALALSALLSESEAWSLESAAVEPPKRAEARVDLFSGLVAPALAPDLS